MLTGPSSAPLEGIRVVELAEVIQGPVATRALADLGAQVIKLEPPSGDTMRYWRTQFNVDALLQNGFSLAFNLVNRNKQSLVVDLHTDAGIRLLHRLVATAHVFVTNLRAESLLRFRADYESLVAVNPTLVFGQGLGLGEKGPDAERPIHDLVGMAHSGFFFNASPDGASPYYVVGAIADILAGTGLATGVLAALRARDLSGRPQYVSCSQLQAMLWLQMMSVGVVANAGRQFPPFDRSDRYNPLVNFYRAGDGKWFTINLPQPLEAWPKLCLAIERPELLDDARFESIESRAENRGTLTRLLDETFASKPREEWRGIFARAGLWLGRVNRLQDLAGDPQVAANGYLSSSEDGVIGPRSLFSLAGHEAGATGAPALGRDRDRILRGLLGLSDDEILGLQIDGATW